VTRTWWTANCKKLLLASIFIVLSSSTIVWTLRDKTPPPWDPADHIRYAYDYYRLISHLDLSDLWHEFFVAPHFYTPLVHLTTATVFLICGASRLTGIGSNLISLAVLLPSVSWITERLFTQSQSQYRSEAGADSPAILAGVLAAMIAACSHFSAWLLHDAFLDFPLMAAFAGSMALLIRADDFRSRRSALQFALAAGLGLLVKQTFAFFFVLPAVYVVIRVLRSRDWRAILNLVLAGVLIALIAAIWYGPHFQDVIAIYRENQRAAIDENEAPLFSFDSNFFCVHALLSRQLQLPFALLMVAGLIYSLFRLRRQSVMIYLWLASGLGMFALVANKDVRYTVPIVPAAAILAACCLHPLLSNRAGAARIAGRALAVAVAVWSLVSFFNAQWPGSGMGTYINTPRYQWMVFARNYYGFDHRPLEDDWSVPEIVQTVAALGTQRAADGHEESKPEAPRAASPKQGASPPEPAARPVDQQTKQPTLGVVVNLPYLNPSGIALYSRLLAPGRAPEPLLRIQWLVVDGSLSKVDECDYILVRTGLDDAEWVAPIEREFEKAIQHSPERFSRVTSFPIPLKSAEAVVYSVKRNEQR